MERDRSGVSALVGLDGFVVTAQLLDEATGEWWLAVETLGGSGVVSRVWGAGDGPRPPPGGGARPAGGGSAGGAGVGQAAVALS